MKDYNSYSRVDYNTFSINKTWEIQLKAEGKEIEINGSLIKAVVRNHGNVMDSLKEERYLMTGKNINVKTGDEIKYMDDIYIVLTAIDKDSVVYDACKMQRCTDTLTTYLSDGILHTFNVIGEYRTMYSLGTEEALKFDLGNAKLGFTIQSNDYSNLIPDRDFRLMLRNKCWVTKNVEYYDGYMKFSCEEEQFNLEYDNKELGIADYYKYNPKPITPTPVPTLPSSTGTVYTINDDLNFKISKYETDGIIIQKSVDGVLTNVDYAISIDYKGISTSAIGVNVISGNCVEITNKNAVGTIEVVFKDKVSGTETRKEIVMVG